MHKEEIATMVSILRRECEGKSDDEVRRLIKKEAKAAGFGGRGLNQTVDLLVNMIQNPFAAL